MAREANHMQVHFADEMTPSGVVYELHGHTHASLRLTDVVTLFFVDPTQIDKLIAALDRLRVEFEEERSRRTGPEVAVSADVRVES